GHYRIIDKVSVELNDRKQNQYEASFANLGISNIPINDDVVQRNPKLLSGNGVWCILTIEYNHSETAKIRWEIDDVKPIQISFVDLEEFIGKRKDFTTEEWIDFLIHSVGLKPEFLNKRDKMIQLARLLPHIENNYNFIELGPKGTGKSHVFQELSPHGVLVSGGDVTSARLFVKYSGNKEILGLVGYWDVIAWDEYEHQPGKRVDPVMIDTMQNYLANKSFNRGKGSHEASASMTFVGNTKHTIPFMLKNSHLFESIPEAFIKGAFLDRIHLYNPGWEVRVLKKTSFSAGLGFITDYLAEILHELRKQDYSPILAEYVKFDQSLSERDHMGIRKTFSGLMKLIYPDKNITQEEALELIDFAVEGRKRVKDQLYIIDETFRLEPAHFKYTVLSTGEEVEVETLECLNTPKIVVINPVDEKVLIAQSAPTEEKEEGDKPKRPRIFKEKKVIKNITVRENQTGISYKSLFAEYLLGAQEITIEDPFVRYPYQIRNLIELLSLIIELNPNEATIKVHLVTNNDEEKIPDSIDAFDEIQDSIADTGIDFSYEFKEFHDRKISTDTEWEIILGRGLDIFEKRSGYTIEDYVQEKRRCKDFNVTYIPKKIK
ncbi:MAG: BREX system Lon protease-like protein BrxL, partial [Dysgonamonadaceae bacterium]|nr:BREX system Lon protease-like protein BrxL [Dysgonamonadaceae bacterium]